MEIYETAWIYADNNNPGGVEKATYTVDGFTPGTNILATIALSSFSEGVSIEGNQNTVGAGGCVVRHWQTFNPDGSVSDHDNKDLAGNSEFIYDCASVMFELSVTFARAYAQANVFLL